MRASLRHLLLCLSEASFAQTVLLERRVQVPFIASPQRRSQISAYASCHSRKLESRCSPLVRMTRSIGDAGRVEVARKLGRDVFSPQLSRLHPLRDLAHGLKQFRAPAV